MSGHQDLTLHDVYLYEAMAESARLEHAAELARLTRELEEAREREREYREALQAMGAPEVHASACPACEQAREIRDANDTGCDEWVRLESLAVKLREAALAATPPEEASK